MKNLSGDECSSTDVSNAVFERVLRERDEATSEVACQEVRLHRCEKELDEAQALLKAIDDDIVRDDLGLRQVSAEVYKRLEDYLTEIGYYD